MTLERFAGIVLMLVGLVVALAFPYKLFWIMFGLGAVLYLYDLIVGNRRYSVKEDED